MLSDKEIHTLRVKNNIFVGSILAGFVVLVFFITIAKMMGNDTMDTNDNNTNKAPLEAKE